MNARQEGIVAANDRAVPQKGHANSDMRNADDQWNESRTLADSPNFLETSNSPEYSSERWLQNISLLLFFLGVLVYNSFFCRGVARYVGGLRSFKGS